MALIKRAKPADELEAPALPEAIAAEPEAEPLPAAITVDVDEEQPGDADTLAALAAVPAEAPADAPAAGADSLLDMFSTVGIQTEDKSMLVGLAGDVDMADLVSELGLVAAALGVVRDQHAVLEIDEALAA